MGTLRLGGEDAGERVADLELFEDGAKTGGL